MAASARADGKSQHRCQSLPLRQGLVPLVEWLAEGQKHRRTVSVGLLLKGLQLLKEFDEDKRALTVTLVAILTS